MPTLEELLRASLKGANEKFDQANKALHAAVVDAAKAVEAVTGGKAVLRLHKMIENEGSTDYTLRVEAGTESRALTDFTVTKKGYPITRNARQGVHAEQFDSPEQLSAYFQKLASDPDSPLVAFLAYVVRNQPDPIPL